ncbi:MAG: glycosyltransferase family 87 protein [Candidatus Firestonebacteria bacterium]
MLKDFKELLKKKSTLYFGIYFSIILIYTLTRHSVDFYPFWMITRKILYANDDLYNKYIAFSYPPFFYCVMSFFAQFTSKVALLLWDIFNISLLTITVILIKRILNYKEENNINVLNNINFSENKFIIPVFIVALVIISDNLWLGQSNILVFFFSVLSLYFFIQKDDRRKSPWDDFLSGLCLSFAISIKVTPLLLLLYFLYKRNFKILPGTIIGLILFFLIIPSCYYGLDKNLIFLKDFVHQVFLPFFKNDIYIRETVYYGHSNQSLDGFIVRHFSDFGKITYADKLLGKFHNFIDPAFLTINQAKNISTIIKISLLTVCALAFTNSFKKNPTLLKFEFAIVFLLILFISPSSWLNHYVSVLFAYYVSVNYIFSKGIDKTNQKILKYILVISALFTCTGLNKELQSYSGMFIGHFILFLGLLFILFKEKNSSVPFHMGR